MVQEAHRLKAAVEAVGAASTCHNGHRVIVYCVVLHVATCMPCLLRPFMSLYTTSIVSFIHVLPPCVSSHQRWHCRRMSDTLSLSKSSLCNGVCGPAAFARPVLILDPLQLSMDVSRCVSHTLITNNTELQPSYCRRAFHCSKLYGNWTRKRGKTLVAM